MGFRPLLFPLSNSLLDFSMRMSNSCSTILLKRGLNTLPCGVPFSVFTTFPDLGSTYPALNAFLISSKVLWHLIVFDIVFIMIS